jgi:NadR type nicotinamide-nucleotide adenylyltransferase
VIGKFYPPHAGHHLLIRTAAATSRRVTVLVLAHPVESIALDDRVGWLREVHGEERHVVVHGAVDAHPVDYEDPAVWDLHMAAFRDALDAVTDEPVTAVFSSEPYGAELARRFSAVHVEVDPDRTLAPTSGTAFRSDPVAHWEAIAEPVRGGLARRVVVLGAESTWTTTVSLALRDALRARGGALGLTQWVPEYGRAFTVEKLLATRARARLRGEEPPAMEALVWRSEEFVEIARRQNESEDRTARRGGPVLICDTDAFATGIWHERYLGADDTAVGRLARRHPLYLLTHHDGIPFRQDGIRDGEAIREWMTGRFLEALADSGRRTVVLRGTLDARVRSALDAIDALIAEGWSLAGPVTPANAAPSL